MSTTRAAGYNERRCIARDVHGLYGCIIVVGQYSTPAAIEVHAWRSKVISALQTCVTAHAALRTVVKDSMAIRPLLSTLNNLNVDDHLQWLRPVQAKDDHKQVVTTMLQQAHAQPLDRYEERPQWKLLAQPVLRSTNLSSFYLAFACSHVMLDGMSGTIFHRSMQDALVNGGNAIRVSPSLLSPALDQAVKMPISWSFLLKPLAQELLPGRLLTLLGLANDNDAWKGGQPPEIRQGELVKTAIVIVSLESAALSAVIDVCRSHKAKLTALLNLLIAKSLASALKKRGQHYDQFLTSTPYDLRRLMTDSIGRMANYVSVVDRLIVVEPDNHDDDMNILSPSEWAFVQNATLNLQERSSTLEDQPIALLGYISDFNEWVKKRAASPRQDSFSVSNIGSLPITSAQDPWRVTGLTFSQSADATGSPLNVNVASSTGGSLDIVFTWWPGILGVEDETTFVREVGEDLSMRLQTLASSAV